MDIPNEKECLEIIKEFDVPENIIKHSMLVEKIAVFLGKRLIEKGEYVNLELVRAASILHDIDKIQTLKGYKDHGQVAHDYLKIKYPEVGKIIKLHLMESPLVEPFTTWEQKIVYYADKRVNHAKIVSTDERIKYTKEKYGIISEEVMQLIMKSEPVLRQIEKEIFEKIGISPEELVNHIK